MTGELFLSPLPSLWTGAIPQQSLGHFPEPSLSTTSRGSLVAHLRTRNKQESFQLMFNWEAQGNSWCVTARCFQHQCEFVQKFPSVIFSQCLTCFSSPEASACPAWCSARCSLSKDNPAGHGLVRCGFGHSFAFSIRNNLLVTKVMERSEPGSSGKRWEA